MRQQAIHVLGWFWLFGSGTDTDIASALGIPSASVRRSIQELIHDGYPLSYAGHSGVYTYVKGV